MLMTSTLIPFRGNKKETEETPLGKMRYQSKVLVPAYSVYYGHLGYLFSLVLYFIFGFCLSSHHGSSKQSHVEKPHSPGTRHLVLCHCENRRGIHSPLIPGKGKNEFLNFFTEFVAMTHLIPSISLGQFPIRNNYF